MADIFYHLLSACLPATVLALAVMVVHLLFRRMPKRVLCLLWLLVALRLLVPFSVESPVSLQPAVDPVVPILSQMQETIMPENTASEGKQAQIVQPDPSETVSRAEKAPVSAVRELPAMVWLAGVLLMLGYMVHSYVRLYRRVAEAVRTEKGVYRGCMVDSPFVLGFFRPRIYLPEDLNPENAAAVLAHERCHIRRHDHWWKPLAFLLLTVYWFNPVLWAAYLLLCRDIEGACDERVLENMDRAQRADYSRALVVCAVRRRQVLACPVAFGEVGVKGRVKNILSYKRPTVWVILLAIATCIMLAVCFMTDPKDELLDSAVHEAIMAQNNNEYCVGQAVESHKVFQVKRSGDTVTVYAMVLYEEILPDLSVDCAGHNAAKLTFTGNRANGYQLQDYWVPKDGTYYAPSIRENFPVWLWGSAMNTQRYIQRQKTDCLMQAQEGIYSVEIRDATKIFNKRTQYLGDNAAVGDILNILGAGQYGDYTVELVTDKAPYGLILHYKGDTLQPQYAYGWAAKAQQVAWMTLSLVENAEWMKWDVVYPNGTTAPGGYVAEDDTELNLDWANYSPADLLRLQADLELLPEGNWLIDGTYTAKELVYAADGDITLPDWENRAALTVKTTVDEQIVDDAQAVTVDVNWTDGKEQLHNLMGMKKFDAISVYEVGGTYPQPFRGEFENIALLNANGTDTGLRLWMIGSGMNYYLGRVDENGNTLYVYRCETTE
ncbi:MAG: DUF4825 domain-containing protein [Clostridiales bacterium]|nr:DUF4825 domain-containing protein [Candidatus Cacconaster stercorequi]